MDSEHRDEHGTSSDPEIRILVIETDPSWTRTVGEFIARLPELRFVGLVSDQDYALPILGQRQVDLLLLDMSGATTSDFEQLRELDHAPLVIITTRSPDHAMAGFEYGVADLLLKPYTFERFKTAISRAIAAIRNKQVKNANDPSGSSMIAVRSGRRSIFISTPTICMAEANGNHVNIQLEDRRILANCTMKEIEALLPSDRFTRVHRSYIVADRIVLDQDRNTLFTKIGEIPIGAAYRKSVRTLFLASPPTRSKR